MSDGKQILKNIFSLSVAEYAAKGFAMIYTIYLMRIIGPENNGIYTVAKSYISYILIFIWLGFDLVGIREVVKDRKQIHNYVSSILAIRLSIAVLGYLILIIILETLHLNDSIDYKTRLVIYVYGLVIFGNAIHIYWVFQAIERMYINAIRSVLINTLNLVGILLFVRDKDDLLIAIWIIVISTFLNSVWMLYYYVKTEGKFKFTVDFKLCRNILIQSFSVGALFLIVQLYNSISVQILSYFKGDVQTGIYGAALQVIIFGLIPSVVLQGAFFPKFSRIDTFEERNSIVSKFLLMSLIVGVAISFTLFTFSEPIVAILGKKYSSTNGILKFLSATILIQYISISFFSPLLAWKKEKLVIFANIAGLTACIIFSILLIPEYGYYGAAIAAIACEFAVLAVAAFIFYREQKTIYLTNIITVVLIGVPSFIIGHYIFEFGLNVYFSSIISIIIFSSLILAFKVVRISELKTLISKEPVNSEPVN